MKRAIIFLLFFPLGMFAQNTKGAAPPEPAFGEQAGFTGSTYGLVIGISEYQNFPKLRYADRDAMAFADFLRSTACGHVPEENIRLLLNEQAKGGSIFSALSWLKRTVKSGDRVFIYFSGHGDAYSEEESFLLAWDAPPGGDDNNYLAGGTIQIYNLKNRIHEMTANKVQVIFITDACRSNELPGKANGAQYTFRKIMEEHQGEFQMNSCHENEFSLEDARWGGGRGVFSWYLVNGLMGMADKDEDGLVTFIELQNYVTENVGNDTKSKSSPRPRQTPVFYSPDDYATVAKVDPELKKKTLLAMQAAQNAAGNLAIKGVLIFTDSADKHRYESFMKCIEQKKFYSRYDPCAWSWLNELTASSSISETMKFDLEDIYIAEVMNYSQSQINDHLQRILTYIEPCYSELNSIFRIADLSPEELNNLKAQYYFFRAAEVAQHTADGDTAWMKEGIAWCDSGLVYVPDAAYLYDVRGYIQNAAGMDEEAVASYFKAMQLAPHWVLPVIFMAQHAHKTGNDSLAIRMNRQALLLDTGIISSSLVLSELGTTYLYMWRKSGEVKERDSSIFYYRASIARKGDTATTWYNLSICYSNDTANRALFTGVLRKALSCDPHYEKAIIALADHYYKYMIYDSALYYYRAWDEYAENAEAEFWVANSFMGMYSTGAPTAVLDTAILYFKKVLSLREYPESMYWMALAYEEKGDTDQAIRMYEFTIDQVPLRRKSSYYRLAGIYEHRKLGKHKARKYTKLYQTAG